MNLARTALKNPYAVIVLVLALVVLGINSLLKIPTDLLPIFKTPAVQILTLYPGMPPEVVERDITSRLERWTGQAVGIEHQEARSFLGVSIVKDFFREDIDPDTAMSQVTSLAVSDMFYLPPGTLPPMVMPFDPTASVPLCLLSVSSPELLSEKDLYDVAYYEMRNRLQSIQGVIAPAVYGGVLRRILAYVDRDLLDSRNLSPMDVVRGIQKANVFVPTGSVKMGERDYLVLTNAMVEDPVELNDAPLRIDEMGPVFIKDVGFVEDSHQIQSNIVRINGRRQVYIPIYRQPGANTLAIVDTVREKSEQILQRVREFDPEKYADLQIDVVMDQSEFVRGSIGNLTDAALIGALCVAVIVLLFLGSVRSSAIVLTAIPLSILGAFVAMYFTGDTINSMTLGGLALAIGILIDQAIVVVENINRHLRMAKTPIRAALDGTREVALPILVSTMTFIVVFYPVVFLSGMARYLFTPLALAVTFATITSYLLATTFVPVACAVLLKPRPEKKGLFDRIADRYRDLVGWTLRVRGMVIASAIGLLALMLSLGAGIGTELFPPVDAGQFTVLVRCTPGTNVEATEAIVRDIENVIMDEVGAVDSQGDDESSDLALLISNIGVLYDWPAAYTPNTGPMDAFVQVQLKDDRTKTSQEYADQLREVLPASFAGVEFAFDTGGMLTAALNLGLPSPINFKVQGSSLETSHEIARAIVDEVSNVEGAVDVRIAQPLDYPALMIQVDRVKAGYLGLTQEDVIKNVATALNSSVNFAPSFWISPENGNHYLIGAQYREEDIKSFETIENIPITGSEKGPAILLKNIATIERTTAPVVIDHRNITRTIDVYANVSGRAAGTVAAEMESVLASSPRIQSLMDEYGDRGYSFELYGEISSMRDSFDQFSTGILIAAILVYLVIVAQFRSFVLPLVIILSVPLGLIGVIAALLLTGTNFGIPAFMGLILMVGIVVQYSILMVDFAVRKERDGVGSREAIMSAARERLRPILMTAAAAAFALLPMAIGLGHGSEANAPLARAMLGGVIAGSLLTLLVVPSIYTVFANRIDFKASAEAEEALL